MKLSFETFFIHWKFVFPLEVDEMKFSYTVLRGGFGSITYLNKVYDWSKEHTEIQTIAEDITSNMILLMST